LATKDKKPAATTTTAKTKVTRISANDSTVKASKDTPTSVEKKSSKTPSSGRFVAVPAAIGGYFKGAWYELRQVNWPSRKATWGLTAAMLAFTGFFVVVILLLDALFKYLFQLMLG
jgi:preprotein translocase SecE subunit